MRLESLSDGDGGDAGGGDIGGGACGGRVVVMVYIAAYGERASQRFRRLT